MKIKTNENPNQRKASTRAYIQTKLKFVEITSVNNLTMRHKIESLRLLRQSLQVTGSS